MASMTCFKSFKNRFVTIHDNSTDNVEDETSLAVWPSFIGEWALQYEPIGDTLHLPKWAIETKCRIIGGQPDSEVLLLQSSHHDKEGDQSTPFSILARKSQDEKAVWSNFFKAIIEPSSCKGKRSISLWDLGQLGGLLIRGLIYDEVVPSAEEMTGIDKDSMLYLPANCRYLFFAYHRLLAESKKAEQEQVFVVLGVKETQKELVYLATFLACWLCKFVLPIGSYEVIRPGVFKVAFMMARGERFSLAIPVLASIYRGLNDIANSSEPWKCDSVLLVHYVYAWLEEYFNTHFGSDPKSAPFRRVFNTHFALDLFRRCDNLAMDHFAQQEGEYTELIDDGELGGWQIEYLISIRSRYLTLQSGSLRVIEPSSPHRFSPQFGFSQDILGKLKINLRSGNLRSIVRHWEYLVCENTQSTLKLLKRANCRSIPVTKVPRHRPQPIEILEGDGTEDQLSTERNSDRCWKHVASDRAKSLHPVAPFTTQVNAGTFFDGVLSSSRSFPQALNNVEEPQGSSDSIEGPNNFDLAARSGGQLRVSLNVDMVADIGVSKFDNSIAIRNVCRQAAIMLADNIFTLLDRASFEKLPSLRTKFEELYKEFALLGVDYSPLLKHIESYMANAGKCVSIRAEYSNSMTSASQSERLTSISHQISQESGFMKKDVESVHVMRRELNSIDAKCIQLRRELGNLEACSVQLGTSIEEIEVQASQRQATIDHLLKERVAIEQTQLVTEGELQVASKLQNVLKKEHEEIKHTPWI
ncbi:hypothetical protein Vadar_032500 [Vaccinium darrowii]|uniref:Uncharacterized protein n=1 Tax=Vaccinium darrowii TaxID=229202 RepID=A0ACB7YZU1_9ERIC|nr:hypothetical protein Vadar_032500 [Vaccinium darrowii]